MLTLLVENWWLYVLRGSIAILFGLMALVWPGITVQVLVVLFGVYVILEGALAMAGGFKKQTVKSRWLLIVEGALGIAVGLAAFALPGLTAVALLIFIAVWAVLTGLVELAAAFSLRRQMAGKWVLGLAGAASILIGVLLLANPGAGIVAVIWLIGIYALIFGLLLSYLGIKARKMEII